MRLLARVVLWTVGGLWVLVFLATTAPALLGYRTLTVLSGSMEPAISTGDLIISERISPYQAHRGDVVTFMEPGESRRLITHRVKRLTVNGPIVDVVTKGDANNTVERWNVSASGHIGRVVTHLPKMGYLRSAMNSGYGRIGLIVFPIFCLGIWELIRIWRPEDKSVSRTPQGARVEAT